MKINQILTYQLLSNKKQEKKKKKKICCFILLVFFFVHIRVYRQLRFIVLLSFLSLSLFVNLMITRIRIWMLIVEYLFIHSIVYWQYEARFNHFRITILNLYIRSLSKHENTIYDSYKDSNQTNYLV